MPPPTLRGRAASCSPFLSLRHECCEQNAALGFHSLVRAMPARASFPFQNLERFKGLRLLFFSIGRFKRPNSFPCCFAERLFRQPWRPLSFFAVLAARSLLFLAVGPLASFLLLLCCSLDFAFSSAPFLSCRTCAGPRSFFFAVGTLVSSLLSFRCLSCCSLFFGFWFFTFLFLCPVSFLLDQALRLFLYAERYRVFLSLVLSSFPS